MYLANTGNIVQALDARTGDLIWENRIGPEVSSGLGAIRSLALYQDKVYLATTDVRLVALDARTGKTVWETRIADTSKGYSNTSGPLVVGGKVIQGMGGVSGMAAAPLPIVMIALQPVVSEFGTARDGLVRDPSGEFDLSGVLSGKYVRQCS
jgi:outer membrane protein assembly factor BamB